MIVVVNGETHTVARDLSVADVVAALVPDCGAEDATVEAAGDAGNGRARAGIAVAVNGELVTRASWAEHALDDGDRVEILTAHQGG